MVMGENGEKHDTHVKLFQKYCSFVLLIFLAVYITIDYFFIGFTKGLLISFLKWVEHNPWPGVFAFAGVYAVATVLFCPGSILTLGAGFVFGRAFGVGIGVALGTCSVFVGAATGAVMAFLLGRYIFYDIAQEWLLQYRVLRAIDEVIGDMGFKIMMLLRLSPVIPFNAINYVMAGTKLSFRAYVITLVGILPGTATYVFIGATAGSMIGFNDDDDDGSSDGHSSGKVIELVALCVGIVLALVATFLLSLHSRKRFMEIVGEARDEHIDIVSTPPSRELMSPIHRESPLVCDMAKEGSSSSGSTSRSAPKTSSLGYTPNASSFVDREDLNVYM